MPLTKTIAKLLESIDIFSYPIAFLLTFKGRITYSTIPSKTLTIIVGIICLFSFFYFSRNYVLKKNPVTLLKEVYIKDPPEIAMNSDFFFFSIAMDDPYKNYTPYRNQSIYVIEAELQSWGKGGELIETERLILEGCSEKHIPISQRSGQTEFSKKYKNLYCFHHYSKAKLNGSWDSEGYLQSSTNKIPFKAM